jgi:hypothetical protein
MTAAAQGLVGKAETKIVRLCSYEVIMAAAEAKR